MIHLGFAKQAGERVSKSFRVTTSPEVMGRFERFLSLLTYNSAVGHSATFGMSLDGDGPDRFEVSPDPRERYREDLQAFEGSGDVECASSRGFYNHRARGFAKQALEVTGDGSLGAYSDDSYAGTDEPSPTRVRGEQAKLERRRRRGRRPEASSRQGGPTVLDASSGYRQGGEALS